MDLEFTNNTDLGRYEAHGDGKLAALVAYSVEGDEFTILHTVVQSWAEGQGVGSALVRHVLDDVRARGGMRVRPVCTFAQAFLERHPEYDDLIVDAA
ncbi:GNAT family N-acetyltransferase [Gulosibacter massiliensis]|uniref:GNAT family N-acetyltransferase n=1 Tax=Gulosibacter massiliensis TaxID=2479839 RepID=UPI000F63F890|nr:GNAT family N-acetyltransferase [Gulosibacter massiliensis]